jgi:DNA-binding CsgD family transcriptional regulator
VVVIRSGSRAGSGVCDLQQPDRRGVVCIDKHRTGGVRAPAGTYEAERATVVNEDPLQDMIDNLLRQRLQLFQRVSGLPVVFGGATRRTSAGEQQLVISQLLGTISNSLDGLAVAHGRGLGGTTIARGVPCLVNDYASTKAITHDYDRHVVDDEKLTSVFAYPIRAHGKVSGVFYGAVRSDNPIGEVALRRAAGVASKLELELDALLGRQHDPRPVECAVDEAQHGARNALAELAMIIRTTHDPALREKLRRIHQQLSGEAPAPPAPSVKLAPREVDALRLVAIGASNLEIAGQLGLSLQTVKAYLRSAMRKLDVRNRTAAVHAARSSGVI